MRLAKTFLLASTLLSATGASAFAEVNVVASIKPVHSLVAAVMEGVSEPSLIIDGAASPHTYALKPSQAQTLEQANLVFWIGHELEAFLEKPLETIGANAKSIELIDAHDLIKLDFREGGAFDAHDHDDHDDHAEGEHDDHDHDKHAEGEHDDHDHEKEEMAKADDHDHDHDKHDHEEHAEGEHDDHDHEKEEMAKADDHDHDHDKHDHEEHAEGEHDDHDHEKEEMAKADDHDHDKHDHEEHAEAGHDGHDHGEFDAHVWLDPVNAKAMVHEIEEALVAADPANAAAYEANAEAVMAKLDALVEEVSSNLEPVHDQGFIVFHDAYQYFEKRFDVTAAGSITISPEVAPGAERITEIRAKVEELGAACVFSEPQFEPKLVTTVTEGTQAKSGVLDPLGATLDSGSEMYFELIRNMSTSIKTCLTKAS